MIRDDKIYLQHIIEAINFIDKHCSKMTARKFYKNELLQNAMVRQLEIIGEAAKCISAATKKKVPDVEWNKVVGMRNKLIHEYLGVDLSVVWTTIKGELPKLKKAISKYLNSI